MPQHYLFRIYRPGSPLFIRKTVIRRRLWADIISAPRDNDMWIIYGRTAAGRDPGNCFATLNLTSERQQVTWVRICRQKRRQWRIKINACKINSTSHPVELTPIIRWRRRCRPPPLVSICFLRGSAQWGALFVPYTHSICTQIAPST